MLVSLCNKYKKSPAQVLIRYGLQKGWSVLPDGAEVEDIIQNTQVFGFELDRLDMMALDGIQEDP